MNRQEYNWNFEGTVTEVNQNQYGVRFCVEKTNERNFTDEIEVDCSNKSPLYDRCVALSKGQNVKVAGFLGGRRNKNTGKLWTALRVFHMDVLGNEFGGGVADRAAGVFAGAKVLQRNAPDDDDLGWK